MKAERLRILKMVEDGKLSVDEALTLLESLESKPTGAPASFFEKKEQDSVKFEEAKKEESVNHKFQTAKDKIFDFVDTALKKIKDIDLDLNFGHSIEVSHVFQHSDAVFKDLDVEVANGSVKLIPWDQKDVRIECHAKVYRVETPQEARDHFMKDVSFALDGDKLRFHTSQKWMKLDAVLYIPQTQYDRVRIRMFNGPVSGEELAVNDYRVKTANGKIELAGISGKRLEAETANGQILIKRSKIDKLEAESINGAIKLDGDFKFAELQTFNGNLTCHLNSDRCESIVAKGATGNIDLYVPVGVALHGDLKTNLGGLNVLVEGVQITEEKSEVVQKALRFQSVMPSERQLKIFADTKTGSVHIKKAETVGSIL
ncbi:MULTISPECIES: DUF4097 domain-containing protein [unclassified Bacillus (in: firmicutes)]|uniref:DUF4097 family beta strand repeat-containing protein n=1 Tax=unclassified Bacillus (in: firmicutes) TaxID=185979 RepID=UPI0008EB517C|nr:MULTISPECIES: DUF4097 domain-containing protein [unclassified Bacillus (in: firmicutes)]SFB21979.1 DUF4097 and DUF4098 domain-containing protein YvlB [Bacillus sp. UNCCL13]SFQ91068.1 DUF4097 and DUF4098 domain-containing protein YvlB [Bacillus sp. cl95]